MIKQKLQPIEEWRHQRFTKAPDIRTVRRWCESQEIPAKRIGKNWYVIINEELDQVGDKAVDDLVKSVLKAS